MMQQETKKIKVFIIMFNRLTWPKNMAEFLSDTGSEVILIDNNSTYPPLLHWYESCPYKVHRLTCNYGHMVFWNAGISNLYTDEYYVVTDPDLDLSGVPSDYINVLMNELNLYKNIAKCGFSLSIDDLPSNPYTDRVKEFESQYWRNKIGGNGFYNAALDTTFSLYNRNQKGNMSWSAVRSPHPYMARHLPWYNTADNLTEEEIYYIKTANSSSSWLSYFKKDFTIK